MKIPIASYVGSNWKAAVFYSEYPDIYNSPPPNLVSNTKHVAHVQYSYGNVKRSLDVHLLNNGSTYNNLNVKKIVRIGNPYHENVDERQGIKYEFLDSIKDTFLEKELIDNLRCDIDNFCRNPAAERVTYKKYSRAIIPVTEIKFNNPKNYLTSGKHDFVESCFYRGNLDFSTGRSECIAGFIPGDSLGIKSSFDGKTFTGFFNSLLYECLYCYAGYQHKVNAPFPKTLIDIDSNKLENELRNGEVDGNKQRQPIKVLRIGKRVEVGTIYTRKQLITTLETVIKTGTKIVMPTRALEFNKEVSDLFKRSNSSILYSEGDFENVQAGLIRHGYTPEFRKEQARLYREAGNKAGFFLLIDAPSPPTFTNLSLMEYARKHDIAVQLLPIRLPSSEAAALMLGKDWDEMKGSISQTNFDGVDGKGGYIRTGNNYLTSKHIHQDWLNLIKNSVGVAFSDEYREPHISMCHHAPDGQHTSIEYCGGCLIGKFKINKVPEKRMIYTKKPNKIKRLRDQHKMEFLKSN